MGKKKAGKKPVKQYPKISDQQAEVFIYVVEAIDAHKLNMSPTNKVIACAFGKGISTIWQHLEGLAEKRLLEKLVYNGNLKPTPLGREMYEKLTAAQVG